MIQLILGSQSPRRVEILSRFKLPFKQAVSAFDEKSIPFEGDPAKYVSVLAQKKGEVLYHSYPNAAIISADSIVFKSGKVYGKPEDEQEAIRMLQDLSGSWHSVYTGIALNYRNNSYQSAEETKVLFNPLTDKQIKNYLHAINWSDKAGAYGIQGNGGILINRIEGCFYNVMGLPINALRELFSRIGVDLWQHL